MEGIKIFRFDASLIFSNAELFRESLYSFCEIDLTKATQWMKDNAENVEQNGAAMNDAVGSFHVKSTRVIPHQGRRQEGGGRGACSPKPRGGIVARAKLGARPPDPVGAPPQTPFTRGSGG